MIGLKRASELNCSATQRKEQMIYRPSKGSMWDPSVIWHGARYCAFMMYNQDGPNGLDACFLSSEIPGFRRVDVPEKTVGNSRVLPFGHFIGLCGCF